MLKIRYSAKFKKDYKNIVKRGYDQTKFQTVLTMLCNQEELPRELCDHPLKGDYSGHRECHIEPDWLLIYKVQEDVLTLTLTRTGSHSDLF